ncbi:FeoA family protein [Desulfovirgula thermocuniculi]|uniref:FeoA family protein n=1 Tax=Desulfovirgula thermocuniculi TaxID=348842 RepID=UPI00047F1A59|nr:ferrous iron transport protein A [Desulfovirgula thermocuniculi]
MKEVPLSRLPPGQKAEVRRLLGEGPLKFRLLDLGFVPGTTVEAVRRSPLGDPVAFCVRGALVALRSKDADLVLVEVLPGDQRRGACP